MVLKHQIHQKLGLFGSSSIWAEHWHKLRVKQKPEEAIRQGSVTFISIKKPPLQCWILQLLVIVNYSTATAMLNLAAASHRKLLSCHIRAQISVVCLFIAGFIMLMFLCSIKAGPVKYKPSGIWEHTTYVLQTPDRSWTQTSASSSKAWSSYCCCMPAQMAIVSPTRLRVRTWTQSSVITTSHQDLFIFGLFSSDWGQKRGPPDMVGSCEHIEQAVAGSRQGVDFQRGGWAWS
jgi:hypothetical protein